MQILQGPVPGPVHDRKACNANGGGVAQQAKKEDAEPRREENQCAPQISSAGVGEGVVVEEAGEPGVILFQAVADQFEFPFLEFGK